MAKQVGMLVQKDKLNDLTNKQFNEFTNQRFTE